MNYDVKYNGLTEREQKIKVFEANGLRMLTDTFDNPAWKHGDAFIGTMIFTDDPAPAPPPQVAARDPLKELDALKIQLKLSGVIE